jgi:hypothetical protein
VILQDEAEARADTRDIVTRDDIKRLEKNLLKKKERENSKPKNKPLLKPLIKHQIHQIL